MELSLNPFQVLMDGMPETAVLTFMSLVVMRLVPARLNLFEQEPDSLVLLYSGSITQYLACWGKLVQIAQHGPGSVLGLGRVLQAQQCVAQAVTSGECSVGLVAGSKFRDFLHQYPRTYLPVSRILSREAQNAVNVWKSAQRLSHGADSFLNLEPPPSSAL